MLESGVFLSTWALPYHPSRLLGYRPFSSAEHTSVIYIGFVSISVLSALSIILERTRGAGSVDNVPNEQKLRRSVESIECYILILLLLVIFTPYISVFNSLDGASAREFLGGLGLIYYFAIFASCFFAAQWFRLTHLRFASVFPVVVGTFLICYFSVSLSRREIAIPLAIAIFFYYLKNSSVRATVLSIAAFVIIVVVSNYVLYIRTSEYQSSFLGSFLITLGLSELWPVDLAIIVVQECLEGCEFRNLRELHWNSFNPFTSGVDVRSIDEQLATKYKVYNTGVGTPFFWFGVGFLNFGLVGICIWSMLLFVLLRVADQIWYRSGEALWILYAIMFTIFIFFRNGDPEISLIILLKIISFYACLLPVRILRVLKSGNNQRQLYSQ